MSGVNKVIIVGNLGRDAELRYTGSGTAKTEFSVAVSYNKDTTEWFNVTLWGETGERISQYLTKGKQVYVEGRLETQKWSDNEGEKHERTMLVAHTVTLLGSGQGGESASEGRRRKGSAPADDDLPWD